MNGNIITFSDMEIVSRTQSYFAWRRASKGVAPPGKLMSVPIDPDTGVCKLCGGLKEINSTQHGRIRCLCAIVEESRRLEFMSMDLQSAYSRKSLDDFRAWGEPSQAEFIDRTKEHISTWMEWPDKWLTIWGPPGVGKTHIMSAIASQFYPWSLYITAGDFESLVFRSIREEQDLDILNVIKHWPILLLDDIGSEYVKDGKDFVRSKLRTIVDFRYVNPLEFPTILSTNLLPSNLRGYDMRIADRVLEEATADQINMRIDSWRRKDDADS